MKGLPWWKIVLTGVLVVLLTGVGLAEVRVGGSKSKPLGSFRSNPYSSHSLANPFGAGNPYRPNGLFNPYSSYGSPYSNYSWRNPYATKAPKLYSSGKYRGRWSTNRYAPDSTSNPFGRYGSPYSPESLRNPYGAGSPFSTSPIWVYPGK